MKLHGKHANRRREAGPGASLLARLACCLGIAVSVPAAVANPVADACLPTPIGDVVLLDDPGCFDRLAAHQRQAGWRQALVAGETPACWRQDGPLLVISHGATEVLLSELAVSGFDACPAAAATYRARRWDEDIESCENLDLPDELAAIACRRAMSDVRHLPPENLRHLRATEMLAMRIERIHPAEAEELLERALAVRQKHFPDDDTGLFDAMIGLASLRLRLRGPDDAPALARYREVLDFGRRRLGEGNANVIVWTLSLGKRLLDWGRLAEGEALMDACQHGVAGNRAGLGRYAVGLAAGCARILGEAYARIGRADDALRMMEQARRERSAHLLGRDATAAAMRPIRHAALQMSIEHPAGSVELWHIPCQPEEAGRKRFFGILGPRGATSVEEKEIVCWGYSGQGIVVRRQDSDEEIELPESALRYEFVDRPEDWVPEPDAERGPSV